MAFDIPSPSNLTIVLYTTDDWGSACPVLRVTGPAQRAGVRVLRGNTWHFPDGLTEFSVAPIAEADLVVVQRDFPRTGDAYEQVIAAARQHNRPIVYEVDDMLWNLPDKHPGRDYYTQHRLALLRAVFHADVVTTSTEPLAEYLRAFHHHVHYLPNYLNETLWTLRAPRVLEPGQPVVIGYMGGITHQPDIALIEAALLQIAQRYGQQVAFHFWGLAEPPRALATYSQVTWESINVLDYADFARFWLAQTCDIGIAPLEDNFFNRCKSHIKFLEYAALGVPGVYSRLPPYQAVVREGENGLLAEGISEWVTALARLMDDPALRFKLAQEAQATVQRDWLLSTQAVRWRRIYEAVVTTHAAAPQLASQAVALSQAQMMQAFWEEQTRERNHLLQHINALDLELKIIKASPTYTVLRAIQNWRARLAPPHSGRERLLETLVLANRARPHIGLGAALRQVAAELGVQAQQAIRNLRHLRPPEEAYLTWMKTHEPTRGQLRQQRAAAAHLPRRPFISIVTPVFNPPPAAWRDTLASVRAQTYPDWEWCLVDGGTDPVVRRLLADTARRDRRLRWQPLASNLGISGNLNAALALTQGEWVLILDHDDTLAPEALFRIAQALNQMPEAEVVYFDEDKLTEDGRQRHAPWFKPSAWSPDLLRSTNYWMHCAVRRETLLAIGGFDSAMDGAQDWDVALRLSERGARAIHIPRVLYHWRQVPGSAARDANAKPWAYAAQERCLQAHLTRTEQTTATVSFPHLGQARIHWPVRGDKASIIIPSKDKAQVLRACLTSIFALTEYPNYEIIIVDTGSVEAATRRYYAELSAEPRVRVVRLPGAFNYSRANNFGATQATGDIFLFLNNDIEVQAADWLTELVGWAERPGVGAVGCKLMRPNGTMQHAGLVMGLAGHGSHVFDGGPDQVYGPFGSSEWYRNYQAVTGACMMMRRAVFEAVNGFDEAYQVCYSDIEICLRANAQGWRTVYTPFAKLVHHEGASRGFNFPLPDILRAYLQMRSLVQAGDPYFNPHLSYQAHRPTIAPPDALDRVAQLTEVLRAFDLARPLNDLGYALEAQAFDNLQALAVDESAWVAPSTAGPIEKRLFVVSHDLSLTGAPLILYKLVGYLHQAGWAVSVISPLEGPLRVDYEKAGIPVEVHPHVLLDARVSARRLPGYGAVLVNTITGWRVIHAAQACQVPSLWFLHEAQYGQLVLSRMPGAAAALGLADQVVFPARVTAKLYQTWLNQNASIVPYGLEKMAEVTLPNPNSSRPLRLVNVASVEPRKGQDILVKGLLILPATALAQLELHIIGQVLFPEFHKGLLEALAAWPQLRFAGSLTHAETLAELWQADIFILASRDEVLPVSILEAMALGKAIIATDVGGIQEMLKDGESGLIIPSEDPAALAAAIERLRQDSGLRAHLGANARAYFETHFTLTRFGNAFIELFERVIQARQTSQRERAWGHRETLGEPPQIYTAPPACTALE